MTVSNESISELFENMGTRDERLSNLVEECDLKGDLRLHREWSDGSEPVHVLNTLSRNQFLTYIRTPKPVRLEVFEAGLKQGSVP